jgi:Domain of unknown function (DUF4136)
MSGLGRWARVGTLAGMALALAACAVPIRVNSYLERGADLSRYRTYDFAPVDAVATGDPRLDSNPFFNARVREAVDRGLTARGYTRAAAGTPDFVVHFHASVAQDIDVADIDRRAGYCADDACKPFVYDAGTLLMDLVDAGTKALVWRGWAESSLDGVVDNQTWMEQKIDAAVGRIMARVPPAAGGRGGE